MKRMSKCGVQSSAVPRTSNAFPQPGALEAESQQTTQHCISGCTLRSLLT